MGKIALNEWPLSGTRIASLNVRLWAKAAGVSTGQIWGTEGAKTRGKASTRRRVPPPRATDF